jgi:hypothetical protein
VTDSFSFRWQFKRSHQAAGTLVEPETENGQRLTVLGVLYVHVDFLMLARLPGLIAPPSQSRNCGPSTSGLRVIQERSDRAHLRYGDDTSSDTRSVRVLRERP